MSGWDRRQLGALLTVRRKLTFRQFRGQHGEIAAAILIAIFAIPIPIILAIFAGIGFLQAPEPWPAQLLGTLFFALWLAWLLFPIFTSPFNDSLDISRLLVHPIRPSTLVAAMALGTVYDYMTVLTAPFVVAVLVAWAGVPTFALVVVAVALAYFHMVVAGQVVATTLAGIMSSRRFRDVMLILGTLTGLTLWSMQFWVRGLEGVVDVESLKESAKHWRPLSVLRWTPPGACAQAIVDASRGGWLTAFAWLGYAAVALTALATLWWRLLHRAMTNGGALFSLPDQQMASARRAQRAGVLRWLPSQMRELVRKEMLLMWRAPRRRMGLFQALVMPMVFLVVFFRDGVDARGLSFVPVGWMMFVCWTGFQNLLGVEGTGLTTVLLSPLPRSRLFLSKLVAFGLITVIPLALITAALVWLGAGEMTLLGLSSAAVVIAAWSAVGGFISVKLPVRVPDDAKRGSWKKEGGLAAGLVLAIIAPLFMGLIISPALVPHILAVLNPNAWLTILAFVWGVAYAVVVARFGANVAGRTLLSSEPEIVAKLELGKTA